MAFRRVIKGSSSYERLCEIAERLGGRTATEFSGVIVGSWKILYRHGTDYMQPRGTRNYGRWNWDTPFGRPADRRMIDFVLLCGPRTRDADETFFLCTVQQARRFAKVWRYELNFAARPLRKLRGYRADFWELRVSFAQLLEQLTSKPGTLGTSHPRMKKAAAAADQAIGKVDVSNPNQETLLMILTILDLFDNQVPPEMVRDTYRRWRRVLLERPHKRSGQSGK